MSYKIYNKRGKLSYRENKLVKDIKDALEKKFGNDPNAMANFSPATSYEELNSLHREYCSTEVQFEEIPDNKGEEHKEFRDNMKETIEPKMENVIDDDSGFIDPFNDANPIVRDYVTDVNLDKNPVSDTTKNNFDEPTTFKDAFTMPSDDIPSAPTGGNNSKKQTKEEPLNPSYNDQSSGRKKRTNKKFAKYIVEAVCMLAERGFIWWTTNKITEAKLAEYELNNEMDLTLLVTMPNGQEATVKQFFKSHCIEAEQLAKYEEEEKNDLAEVLAELLDKKGITPSVEQEALIIAAKMFGQKLLIGLEMNRGINSLLDQLKQMNKPSKVEYSQPQEPPTQQPTETNTVVEEVEGNFADMADIQDVAIIQ